MSEGPWQDGWEANATSFEISRMYYGSDRVPQFVVSWENGFGFEAKEPDEPGGDFAPATPEEGEAICDTLEEAFAVCRGLLAAHERLNRTTFAG